MKTPHILAILAAACLLPSCAGTGGPQLTPEGCIVSRHIAEDGTAYQAGVCIDPVTGKLDNYVVQWANPEGVVLRASRKSSAKVVVIEYQANGTWVRWTQDSGITLGTVPTTVATVAVTATK